MSPVSEHVERNGMFDFEWDQAKAATNLRKHKVDFELAATVILDRLAKSVLDEDHGAFEERWITMGHARNGRLLVVSHTWSETADGRISVRLISARPANRNERRQYESEE